RLSGETELPGLLSREITYCEPQARLRHPLLLHGERRHCGLRARGQDGARAVSLAVADDLQGHGLTYFMGDDLANELTTVGHLLAADTRDDVARLDVRFLGGAAVVHGVD